jgi:CIC family chloride channel protein
MGESATSSRFTRRWSTARFRNVSQTFRQGLLAVIGLSVAVGVFTGLAVAGVHWLIVDVLWNRLERDAWWVVVLPLAGLVASTAVLELTRERSTQTTEEYIRVFHEAGARVRLRSVPLRLLASAATIGFGGSMGLEGPSIYVGAAIGDAVERRVRTLVADPDRRVLLVAGAAAGIAAIFKAPVTGVIFALEVPYRDDLARRALIPAIFAAASAYVVFVSIAGTTPLLPVTAVRLRLVDLGGSIIVGVGCGLGARLFVAVYHAMVAAARRVPFALRWIAGGALLAGIGAVCLAVFHRPLALGPGYDAILMAARGRITAGLLVALFAMKVVATSATGASNGAGGLFFPSVLMGATLGGALGHAVPGPPSLFAVVGIAAFLSGSYNVPLAGVAFVAEATGAPGYIVPGLVAAALAYIVSGPPSLSHRQRSRRLLDVGMRLDLAVGDVMSTDWTEVPPTASVREFATRYAVQAKARTMPVADGGRYVGMVSLASAGDVPRAAWDETPVAVLMRTDVPRLAPAQRLRDAVAAMRAADVDRAPVLVDGRLVGTLQTSDVLRIEQILDAVGEEERGGLAG